MWSRSLRFDFCGSQIPTLSNIRLFMNILIGLWPILDPCLVRLFYAFTGLFYVLVFALYFGFVSFFLFFERTLFALLVVGFGHTSCDCLGMHSLVAYSLVG